MSKRKIMSPNRSLPRLRGSTGRMDANSNADQGVVSADADEESYSACNPSSSTSQQSNSSNESLGDSEGFDVSDDSTFSSSSGTSNSSSERKKKVSRSDDKKKKPFKEKRRDERHISSLEVPKLTGVDDYELWRTMTELKLKVQKLWPIVTEKVLFKDFWNSSQIEKKYNAGSAEKNDLMIKSEMVSRNAVCAPIVTSSGTGTGNAHEVISNLTSAAVAKIACVMAVMAIGRLVVKEEAERLIVEVRRR
ncbi:uncharacterized protein PITG_15167 [Phytophthora infestans T30-4]|uniref:Uncharacterized protein n=1 Tax=Phytophthora infestans (strain T30-4) TaxID=403677 RepID=D0NRT5_PHYIT|nr:uncharacterized protein PITG_15167 [Phytophthora infestans T30-4]EEY63435.1 hypothetical protein PITG_15167 [Phytophthora infestans T30-4]|eukprot:XP_002898320.1 hypothetical protein PITG_15167 [Phytophthora infestans T30-4]